MDRLPCLTNIPGAQIEREDDFTAQYIFKCIGVNITMGLYLCSQQSSERYLLLCLNFFRDVYLSKALGTCLQYYFNVVQLH